MSYLVVMLRELASEFRMRATFWRGNVLSFLVKTAIFFLLLYKLPFLGSVASEAGLSVAVASSVVLSAALTFLLECMAIPGKVYRGLLHACEKQHEALCAVNMQEDYVRKLAELHHEGMKIYHTQINPSEYHESMHEWVERVRLYLRNYASTSELFNFEDSRHNNSWFSLSAGREESEWAKETQKTREAFTGRLQALKHLIQYPSTGALVNTDDINQAIETGRVTLKRYR